MNFFKHIAHFFKKKPKVPKISNLQAPTPQEVAHYSFSCDPHVKYNSQEEMIPEVAALVDRLKRGDSATLDDIATYFKYFENGYELKSPFFRLKKEFSENCLFSIEHTRIFFSGESEIKIFHIVLKEEVTGLRITLEAPTSFFVEFAEQVPAPSFLTA